MSLRSSGSVLPSGEFFRSSWRIAGTAVGFARGERPTRLDLEILEVVGSRGVWSAPLRVLLPLPPNRVSRAIEGGTWD